MTLHLHLQEDGRGETYTTKIVCANDFLVSGAGMKFKLEKVTDTENIVPEVDKWRLANGYGRTANVTTLGLLIHLK